MEFGTCPRNFYNSGPPGEAKIHTLNPHRVKRILEVTGWDFLEPGSLNIEVEIGVVDDLLKYEPTFTEDGKDVNYPEKYKRIPLLRIAYHYYLGYARTDTEEQQVLVRRVVNPVTNHRVELYGPVSLKKKYQLEVGDEIVVRLEQDEK